VLAQLAYIWLYFLLFAAYALQVTYLTLFYHRRGFSDWQIGGLEAIGSVCVILSAFVWGPLADRLGHKRRLLAVLALGTAVFFPLLRLAPPTLWSLVPLVIAFYLCRAPMVPLMDSAFLETLAAGGDPGGGCGAAWASSSPPACCRACWPTPATPIRWTA
jgi:MFS family permease